MELRQLRYFVAVIEHGTLGKAALELGVVTSALSQQISRLEGELSTRLLQRTARGVLPTEAGVAFWRQAQLALRHIDHAVVAARHARLSGHVNVGLPPSAGGILSLPFMLAMRQRYPDVQLGMVEAMTGNLESMLSARQIDVAVLFREEPARKWSVLRLLDERLFFIAPRGMVGMPQGACTSIEAIQHFPLILPTKAHGLRNMTMECFQAAGIEPHIAAEVDGLAILMEAVGEGLGCTIQPGAALARLDRDRFESIPLSDAKATRPALLLSLSDDELSPAGLAARIVLTDVMRTLVVEQKWPGATLCTP
ncbi:LysR family transcriptional regulator [Hydrogenophaga sp.]|uniref:LysR family transcriptional regulator n=1 Tax=Hydrogenophaga sp. TaxID=1904254 RepID=UPI002727C252|nr:LysR family transcriptional regulator [Hydrogenophaga sp.]MDO9436909.1 LysR family transcriptional regulator [Hydrogenophaga sp.]